MEDSLKIAVVHSTCQAGSFAKINVALGWRLLENHLNPYDLPKGLQDLMVSRIASEYCTENELMNSLQKAGFQFVSVSIIEHSHTELGKESFFFCKALGAPMTKDGKVCIIMHSDISSHLAKAESFNI